MWAYTYTQQHLEDANDILFRLMRVTTPQDALNILLPGDSPQTKSEYRQAYNVFSLRIRTCQPNVGNGGLSREEAYRVSSSCSIPPLTLLAHWVRLIALSIALGDYRDALGCILGNHETACQFGDDNILLAATKTGFGAATLLIPTKPSSIRDSLSTVALVCKDDLFSGDCAKRHTERVRKLCADFYQLLSDLGATSQINEKPALRALQIKLKEPAQRIDRATGTRFKMEIWGNELIEQLGR